MLINKYKPKRLNEIVGNKIVLSRLKNFVLNFNINGKKAIILYGGYGKTSSIYALANEINYEIIEINASDVRDKDNINNIIRNAIKQKSLFKDGKIILIEEVDHFSELKDKGGVTLLSSLIEESYFPIVMIADNPWNKKVSNLRIKSELLEFKELTFYEIFMFLKKICDKESFDVNENILKEIAIKNKGDIRGAINDLDIVKEGSFDVVGERDKVEDIFHILKAIFQTKDIKKISEILRNMDMDLNELVLWVDENLPLEYRGRDLVNAYESISKGDVFRGRIKRMQYWDFLVYVNIFFGNGVSLAKKDLKSGFVRYKRNERILKLWKSKMVNSKRDSIIEKISKKTHTSNKRILWDFIYYKIMLKNDEELCKEFRLDDEEKEWILQ